MSSRFCEASELAVKKTEEVREKYFPLLEKATIKVLFDKKQRKKGSKIVLGRMLKANDLIRKLTDDLTEEGCDYIMFLDQVAFENISDLNRERLIRHELRHCKIAGTEEKPRYKTLPHDIEDFVIEIELNSDDVGWANDVAKTVSEIYIQLDGEKKEGKGKKKKKEEPAQEAEKTPAAAKVKDKEKPVSNKKFSRD